MPHDFEGGKQQEVYDYAPREPLKEGIFLCNEEDENVFYLFISFTISFFLFMLCLKGRCKNPAHSAISAIIHAFFYSDKYSLAALYPQDFQQVVLNHIIALVTTVVRT